MCIISKVCVGNFQFTKFVGMCILNFTTFFFFFLWEIDLKNIIKQKYHRKKPVNV